jgi:hypothetical protein
VVERAPESRPVAARPWAVITVAALVLIALPLAGCSGTDDTPTRESERITTMATPTVRTDAAPITDRFPALTEYQDLHWMGEVAGNGDDSRVPGPTDVRIRAVVILTPEAARQVIAGYSWAPAPAEWESGVEDPLRDHLPVQGTWQSNDAYTEGLLGSRFSGTVYVNTTTGAVYLDVIGR